MADKLTSQEREAVAPTEPTNDAVNAAIAFRNECEREHHKREPDPMDGYGHLSRYEIRRLLRAAYAVDVRTFATTTNVRAVLREALLTTREVLAAIEAIEARKRNAQAVSAAYRRLALLVAPAKGEG